MSIDSEFDDVLACYSQIVSMVQKNPPDFYDRCLTIVEDEMGKIRRDDYEYFGFDEKPIYDTSFGL